MRAAAPPAALEVLPENWACLELFLSLETQWRHAGMAGVPTGIDYAALPVAAAALGQELTRERLAELRDMEAAALRVFAARWKAG